MKLKAILGAALAGSLFVSSALADTASGTWRLTSGKVTIRVSQCGGQNLCATIVGLAQPLTKSGKVKVDKDNPNPALRNRPIIGLTVVNGMKPAGSNTWRGSIYNADDGRTYSGTATVAGNNLTISACVLGGLVCKKKHFVRVN